jgi:signal transduction histidine kinase/DNA-binding response OmpR family regulator
MTTTERKPCILVVEDSATQAAALADLLEQNGFEAIVARRADRALTIIREQRIDLVLSDVLMPGMDGYELTSHIRGLPELGTLPVVLLTSLTDPLAIVRGLESGADHYVTKPYEPISLIARVRTVLDRVGEPRFHPKPFTVDLLGTPFTISATKEQILELLVSSYSDLVRTSEAVRDAERRARFLAEATELLSSSLDVQTVLRDLARLVVPRIAEVCAADLLGPGDLAQRVELAHGFGAVVPPKPVPPTASVALSPVAQRAVDARAVQHVAVASDDELADVARDPELLEDLRRAGPFTLVVVPLVARRRVLGVLQFLSGDAARVSSPESLLLVEDLARRAALAVDNALLYGEAQRATKARDDMLAIVSHDLRNPLNTIHMSTSFLLDVLETPTGTPAPVIPQLQLIRRATARGNALIEDLLDVSRIESGTLAVDASLTSASGLLDDAVLELGPLVTSKGLRFESAWEGDDAEVPADRGRIAQVFSNLVGNAIKFTPRDGLVTVKGKRNGARVEFVVSDSGAGIAEADVPRLFDRFWKATKASRGGAGLGLFIVKGIVESHGGSISVKTSPGAGTTFCFSLAGASDPPWRPPDVPENAPST